MSSNSVAIGQGTVRIEDARLITGKGRFTDDLSMLGLAHGYVLRSPFAHARIVSIDISAANRAPGVVLVLTAAEIAADGIGGLPCAFGPHPPTGRTLFKPDQPILAADVVRHVGDRVAFVVAETREQARDAADLIEVVYEEQAAVATLEAAVAEEAPLVWEGAPGNVCFRIERGERADVERAFEGAAHVERLRSRYPRIAGCPMEPRSVIGLCNPHDGRLTLYAGLQNPNRIKDVLAEAIFGIPHSRMRVVSLDVGGAFGLRGAPYPEDVLVLAAARRLGRPVKWTGDRGEAFLADIHGRDRCDDGALAFDRDGHILAMRNDVLVGEGAYLTLAAGVTAINAERLCSPYRVPKYHVTVAGVFTHTSAMGPYRGTGRPEANLFFERAMDRAARALGIDPVEIRRRNLIQPGDMPYTGPAGYVIDSGDFPRLLDRLETVVDWPGFEERRRDSEKRGLLRGRGIGFYVILSNSPLQSERLEISLDLDGTAKVIAGTLASGQGHETMYAQMASDWLGIAMERIRVIQGDTDQVVFGRGTVGNRSAMMGGSALRLATDELVAKATKFAAWMLEASAEDVEFSRGAFRVAGTDRTLSLGEVARKSYTSGNMPPELPVGLSGIGGYSGPASYPNGGVACEVEIDPQTGALTIDRVASVSDSGTVLNPLTLTGQVHGSIVQAAGEMLGEEVVYDDDGQLLTGSFSDYALPRADQIPQMLVDFQPVPTTTNPLGVKGGAENGSAGMPAALANAIFDGLAREGVRQLRLPATPERLWHAIAAARSGRSR